MPIIAQIMVGVIGEGIGSGTGVGSGGGGGASLVVKLDTGLHGDVVGSIPLTAQK